MIDQILKGRLCKEDSILDAECGAGKECKFFFNLFSNRFIVDSIFSYTANRKYDFIICNPVLHFAKTDQEQYEMFLKLEGLLSK